MASRDPQAAQPSSGSPPWLNEMARQTIANALGTLIAALVLLLGGVLLGAIEDVPTDAIVSAAGVLIGALASLAWSIRAMNAEREEEADAMRAAEEAERRRGFEQISAEADQLVREMVEDLRKKGVIIEEKPEKPEKPEEPEEPEEPGEERSG